MSRFAKRPSPGTVIATVALFVALGGVAAALPGQNTVNNGDVKDLRYRNLDLKNGWSAYGSNNYSPAAALDAQGIVHLRGAIAQGIADGNNFARLQRAFRPDKDVYLPVDMTNANQGRVIILQSGQASATAEAGGSQSNAQLFTSLDGVTYEAGR
jgi:hypothetical protein